MGSPCRVHADQHVETAMWQMFMLRPSMQHEAVGSTRHSMSNQAPENLLAESNLHSLPGFLSSSGVHWSASCIGSVGPHLLPALLPASLSPGGGARLQHQLPGGRPSRELASVTSLSAAAAPAAAAAGAHADVSRL